MFAHTLLEFPEQRAALPPHWPLGSLHGIIAASLGVVLLLKPAYFLKHHRTVKLWPHLHVHVRAAKFRLERPHVAQPRHPARSWPVLGAEGEVLRRGKHLHYRAVSARAGASGRPNSGPAPEHGRHAGIHEGQPGHLRPAVHGGQPG
eukprot:jgi/Botrbrau1/12671/Bobra.67_1s0035.1